MSHGIERISTFCVAGKLFTGLAVMLAGLWLCYPFVWALGEGYNLISVDAEVCLCTQQQLLTHHSNQNCNACAYSPSLLPPSYTDVLQIVLYGILDVTSKVVFGWVLILGLGRVSTETVIAAKIGGDVEGGTYSSLNSVSYVTR